MLLVSQVAASRSRADGLKAALGLTTGAAIWAIAAALGLGMLSYLDWLQGLLRLAGGAYLIYLGARIWSKAAPARNARPLRAEAGWRSFRMGVTTNLANPLSLVFFTGIFAALLPPELPAWVRAAAVAIIAVDALLYYVGLALAFSLPPARRAYPRAQCWIDRITGGILALFGLRLMLAAR